MKSTNGQIKWIIAALLACFQVTASAGLIAQFVDGDTNYTSFPMPDLAQNPDYTVTGLSQVGNPEGSNTITRDEFGSGLDTPDGKYWLLWRTQSLDRTLSSTDNYYGFSITSDTAGQLDLDTLSFRMMLVKGSGATDNFTIDYDVFVNTDGGGFTSFGTGSLTHAGNASTFTAPVLQSIDLSSISGVTSADIRIAFSVPDGPQTASRGLFVQDIQVIPEPGTLVLLLLSGVSVFLFRRRK